MTELSSAREALDSHLGSIKDRGMLSQEEVVDILLDIRLLIESDEGENDGKLPEGTAPLVGVGNSTG